MIDKYDFDVFLFFAFLYAIWTIEELRDIKKELKEIRRKLDQK